MLKDLQIFLLCMDKGQHMLVMGRVMAREYPELKERFEVVEAELSVLCPHLLTDWHGYVLLGAFALVAKISSGVKRN